MPEDIDNELKGRQPYREWLKSSAVKLDLSINQDADLPVMDAPSLLTHQKLFNVSFEERDQIIRVLAEDGAEAIGSMGDDTPMAVLSQKVRSPFDYLRQQFAQVTNPPIDPIREAIVMSLNTAFGPERNLFEESPAHAHRVEVHTPLLSKEAFDKLLNLNDPAFAPATLDLQYDPATTTLEAALKALTARAVDAVKAGKVILVLSDRNIAKDRLPIHALFATGAVHHALIAAGLRCNANIVVETGSVRDPHHYACLIGYGATAVYPYLAYQVIGEFVKTGEIKPNLDKALCNFRKGMDKGLYKVLSKMGISLVASYRGAQLFEGVGLHESVIDLCLKGTVSRISGANFDDFESDQKLLHKAAFNPLRPLSAGGLLKFMFGEEFHAYNPDVVQQLQKAVKTGDYAEFKKYSELVDTRPVAMLRDLMKLKAGATPIPLDEVEPLESILKRFDSAGMSLGALSPEAHEALAEGMNRIGGRSNSGEGGEDPEALRHRQDLQDQADRVRPLRRHRDLPGQRRGAADQDRAGRQARRGRPAAGRQGVADDRRLAPLQAGHAADFAAAAPRHLLDRGSGAADLRPEAGQPRRAGVGEAGRRTRRRHHRRGRGQGLCRPHHDFRLRRRHRRIAAGFGQIRRFAVGARSERSTAGAARKRPARPRTRADRRRPEDRPRRHQGGHSRRGILRLRHRPDGRAGLQVPAHLPPEQLRHRRRHAEREAAQDHFIGLPDMVVNYFKFVAEETRELMASLGIRKLTDLIGRTDLLDVSAGDTPRQGRLKLDVLLSQGDIPADAPRFAQQERNPSFDKGELAEQMVADALAAIKAGKSIELAYTVRNVNRSIGARLSGEIAKAHGGKGLPDDTLRIQLTGSAGQSLGVWNHKGLTITLEGDANDYVGKGMGGGRLVIYPPRTATFDAHRNTLIGNTCLYGATGGELYAAGMGGERFGVRNSGALAVVEGIGDHGCEYMTGGTVIVLGDTGLNFGAGMSGGMAFVVDDAGDFVSKTNKEMVELTRITSVETEPYRVFLKAQVERHLALTGSARAKALLADFDATLAKVWLIKPKRISIEDLVEDIPGQTREALEA